MKKTVSLIAAFLFVYQAYGQERQPANPTQALISANPSFAGSSGFIRHQSTYIHESAYAGYGRETFSSALDAYVKPLHGGIAVSGTHSNENDGNFITDHLNLVYARDFECKKTGLKIIPSLQASYLRYSLNYRNFSALDREIVWNMNEPLPSTIIKQNFDFSAGLLFSYKGFYAGGSVRHINQPDVGLVGTQKLPRLYTVNASYNWLLNEKALLNFSALYSKQAQYDKAQFGVNAIFFKHLITGVNWVVRDVGFISLGYRNNFFNVSAGYGLNLKWGRADYGLWQFALGLRLYKKGTAPASLQAFEKW